MTQKTSLDPNKQPLREPSTTRELMAERLKEEAQKVDTFIFDTILNSSQGEKLRELYDQVICFNLLKAVADPGVINSRGANQEPVIRPNFPENCMKMKKKWVGGRVQNLSM